MRPYILVGLVVCAVCGGPTAARANPLDTFDHDRLYVLMQAIQVKAHHKCADYYRDPDQPRGLSLLGGDLSKTCPAFASKVATYLTHNGVAGIEAAHIRAPAFWEQLRARELAVVSCREKLGGAGLYPPSPRPPWPKRRDFPDRETWRAAREAHEQQRRTRRDEYRRAWRECDPYEAAQWENRQPGQSALEQLGISLPPGVGFVVGW